MTISGSVTSSKPISLTKASSILKTFIATETGASQAAAAFLRRSSASFIELVQFHRNLKAGKSDKKQKVTGLEHHQEKSFHLERGESLGVGSEGEGSGKKRRKKNKREEVEQDKRERKKRKKEEDGSKSLEDSEEPHRRKKKRRKHDDAAQ